MSMKVNGAVLIAVSAAATPSAAGEIITQKAAPTEIGKIVTTDENQLPGTLSLDAQTSESPIAITQQTESLHTETPPTESSQEKKTDTTTGFRYPVNHGDITKPELCLTFDDGFSRDSTVIALDTLKQYNIKCTFFITGGALQENAELWKRAISEGHQVCNHTKTHRFLAGLSEGIIRKEVEGWENIASEVLGDEYLARMKRDFPYIRLPGGSGSRDKKLLKVLADMSYIPVGWSTETVYSVLRHYHQKKGNLEKIRNDICSYIMKTSGKGSIILLHLNKYDTAGLGDIIQGLNQKEYSFKLVSNIF